MTSKNQDFNDNDIDQLLLKKQRFVDSMNNRKGKRHWLFKKMPMKASSLENLANSTEELVQTFKTANSVVCPKCSNGILMCDRDISRDYPGKVEWWCSKQCGFKVFALPRFKSVREEIKAPAFYIAQDRLARMSNEQIDKIIKEHQYKSRLFRVATYGFLSMGFMQIINQQWFLLIQWLIISILTYLFALKWAYRAWQIKSKNIYLKNSPFFGWLSNAPKWFSLDWYDQQKDIRDQMQNAIDESEGLNQPEDSYIKEQSK